MQRRNKMQRLWFVLTTAFEYLSALKCRLLPVFLRRYSRLLMKQPWKIQRIIKSNLFSCLCDGIISIFKQTLCIWYDLQCWAMLSNVWVMFEQCWAMLSSCIENTEWIKVLYHGTVIIAVPLIITIKYL